MDINSLFTPVLQIFLVTLRVGAVWMFFPVLSQKNIPVNVRVAGAVTLSMALLPMVGKFLPAWSLAHPPELPEMVMTVARELSIGLGLGLMARWMFTACMASGNWVGAQLGFSAGSIVNPESETTETAWSEFNHWIALMLFLGIGGHWLLIQAVADSYAVDTSDLFKHLTDPVMGSQLWIEVGRKFFFWMLKLSGPMVVVILLLQAAMGVLSRFIPQVNVWLVSIPITIGVGVLVFSFLSPMYSDALEGLFRETRESQYMWLRFIKGS